MTAAWWHIRERTAASPCRAAFDIATARRLSAGAEVNRILRNREVLRIERDHRHDSVRAILGTLARLWTARPGRSGRWRWLAVERRTRQRLPTDSTNLAIGSTAGGACGAGSAAPPCRSRRTSVRSARRETTCLPPQSGPTAPASPRRQQGRDASAGCRAVALPTSSLRFAGPAFALRSVGRRPRFFVACSFAQPANRPRRMATPGS